MQLVILAAGTGSRLSGLTRDAPKSLLDLGDGRSLLERQLDNAAAAGCFERVVIVTGYKAEMLERHVSELRPGLPLATVFNPVYEVSNNLISLWFALPHVRDTDFVVSNGDNVYAPSVMPRVVANGPGIWLTIDRKPEYDDDDMKVQLSEDGGVERVSKEIAAAEATAESVGLLAVAGERYRRGFAGEVEALVRDPANVRRFWLEAVNAACRRGLVVRPVEIEPSQWAEIDFHPDVRRLRREVISKIAWREG